MDTLTFNAEKHEYRVGDIILPSVTQILKTVGIIDYSNLRDASFYMERGKAVHDACSIVDLGEDEDFVFDERTLPYIDAYRKFLAESGFVPESIEVPVGSVMQGYAGTYDMLGWMGKRKVLIDRKTSDVPNWTGLQLAGYEILLDTDRDIDRYGLALKDDKTYRLEPFRDPEDVSTFFGCVQVAKWKMANMKPKQQEAT